MKLDKKILNVDSNFIRKLREGDRNSFAQLVTHFSGKICHTCKKMNLSYDDAQEICQDVFLKLWEGREQLDEEGALSGYIFTMAKNNILKQYRKRAYTTVLEKYWKIHAPKSSPSSEEYFESKELEKYSGAFIERLPEKQKEILKLRINDQLTNDEIALQLKLSKRTVENQMYRALKKLKTFIST